MTWSLLSCEGWGWSAQCRQRQPGNSGDFKSEPARGWSDRSLDSKCPGGILMIISQDLLTDPFSSYVWFLFARTSRRGTPRRKAALVVSVWDDTEPTFSSRVATEGKPLASRAHRLQQPTTGPGDRSSGRRPAGGTALVLQTKQLAC